MTEPSAKLRSLAALAEECRDWRKAGRVVVLANGAFDMLHVGHVRYLAGAKALGDTLVVAVNSDRSVQASKGPDRPIVPENERVELLSHVAVVDRLCLFDNVSVAPILEKLQPQIHAKGTDYTVESVPERHVVAEYGGTTAIVGDSKDHATTDVIATILDRFAATRG